MQASDSRKPWDSGPASGAADGLACAVLSLGNEPGLVRAVRSLLEQSDPVEVVVVNSGGGDPIATLGAEGIDVPVIDHDESLYVGAVRNLGIAATRARYMAFLAADCWAEPGWAAGRLRAHRAGSPAVAATLANSEPDSRSACAAALLLHHRMMPSTPPKQRLFYGLSYDRALFARYGLFREDVYAGEDTEFNTRLAADGVPIFYAVDVRTVHRNTTTAGALLRDQYRRGRDRAGLHGRVAGEPGRVRIAVGLLMKLQLSVMAIRRTPDARDRRRLWRALPLLLPGALASAIGAIAGPPHAARPKPVPVQPQLLGAEARTPPE